MKKPLAVVAFLCLFASLAFGAVQYTRILNLKVLGKTQLGTNDEKDNIANSAFGTVDWAFPVDGGCKETDPVSVTGAKTGDPCFVGLGPSDGGTAIPSALGLAQVSCVVTAADTAILKLCGGSGLGAIIDAGYQIRTFGVQ